MRVGLDVSVLRRGVASGTAVYAYNLARALLKLESGPELVLYFGARAFEEGEAALSRLDALGARIVRGPAPWRWSPDGAWWLPVPPNTSELWNSIDVFHLGEFFFPRSVPAPSLATVHDLTPQRYPRYHQRWNRWLHDRRLRWIEEHADRVIVVSDATGRDLAEEMDIDLHRVDRIYEARGHETVDPDRAEPILRNLGLDGVPYVLMVGTVEPRKNHTGVLRAFERLAEGHPRLRLVLAGGWGWRCRRIRRAIERSPVRERIAVLGEMTSTELMALYRGARVFAFPSHYEGFGIPLLEAMASGVPVLTSSVSSMPEIAGEAALYADPDSVDSIRTGLERLLTDGSLRESLIRKGRRREREFTWERTARETLESYHRAAAR